MWIIFTRRSVSLQSIGEAASKFRPLAYVRVTLCMLANVSFCMLAYLILCMLAYVTLCILAYVTLCVNLLSIREVEQILQ